MLKKAIKPIRRGSVDSAIFLPATFYDITSGGLKETCNFIRIRNESKIDIAVSWNATDIHDIVLAHSSLELFFLNTDSKGIYTPQIPKGTIISVASVTGNPGIGYIYLSGFYQDPL